MKDASKNFPVGFVGKFDLEELEDFDERLRCLSCLERDTLLCEHCIAPNDEAG